MAKPTKRKVPGKGPTPKGGGRPTGGRVTEKGTRPFESSTPETVPTFNDAPPSPPWVPILMFALFGIGMLVIFLNYVNLMPGDEASNWYLIGGLGLILGGIITATQYR